MSAFFLTATDNVSVRWWLTLCGLERCSGYCFAVCAERCSGRCLLAWRDYARECSELAWDCRGFCKMWLQKWFLSDSGWKNGCFVACRDYARECSELAWGCRGFCKMRLQKWILSDSGWKNGCFVAWRAYGRECSELAWGCRGFCNMWLQKWFLSDSRWKMAALWLGGTMQGNVLNWLGIVVDSAKSGCKNGSSLTVGEKMAALWLGGTMQGNVLNWLGIVVDSAKCGCKNGSSLPVGEKMVHRCLVAWRDYARECSELAWGCRGFCNMWLQKWFLSASGCKNDSSLPCGLVGLCKGMFWTGLGLSWILQYVAAKMVPLCQWVKKWLLCGLAGLCKGMFWTGLGLSWILQNVAAKMVPLCQYRCLVAWRDYARECSELAWDCRGFCNMWLQKWFLSASGWKTCSSLFCGWAGLCEGMFWTGLGFASARVRGALAESWKGWPMLWLRVAHGSGSADAASDA